MLRRPFTRQPTQAVGVDFANRITNGLVLAFNAATMSDAVTGQGSTTSIQRVAAKGYTALVSTLSGSQRASFNSPLCNVSGRMTVFAFVNMNGAGGGYCVSKANANGDGADPMPVQFGPNSTACYLNRSTSGGFRVWSGSFTPPATGDFTVAASQPDTTNTPPRFYLNGAFDTGAAVNNFGGLGSAADANNHPIKIGNNGFNNGGFGGYVYAAFLWARILEDQEVASVHRNPWQLFRPIVPARMLSLPAQAASAAFVKITGSAQRLAGNGGGLAA